MGALHVGDAHDELRRAEDRHRTMLDAAGDAILVFDYRTAKATVSFDPLSTTLTPKAKKALRSLAKKTKRTATGGFAIGYVQKDNNPANDASLSKQRARAIVQFLKANGVKAPLTTRGNGVLSKNKTGRTATVSVSYTN